MDIKLIKNNMLKNEVNLSKYASKNSFAIRINDYDDSNEIRSNYFRDIDRIVHSLAYSRYIDKTQVFSNINNDHISKRIIHVQLVSKIARTIGRALNLNEDLIEAIALAHDIGHTPFGHEGEKVLSKISLKNNQGIFMHNVQSVRHLMFLEKKGLGLNLTVQVLDGVLCHNGETLSNKYYYEDKNIDDFFRDYYECYKDLENIKKLHPMTLEGCVVQISDVIAYIGRDIEDAVRLGILNINDIPSDISEVLGSSNREIINTIVIDIISNSYDKPYIMLSDRVSLALANLQKFNYKNIYNKIHTEEELNSYELMFNSLFDKYINDLKTNNINSDIYINFLNDMDSSYKDNNEFERIVIDYIAGMTDDYFIEQYNNLSLS